MAYIQIESPELKAVRARMKAYPRQMAKAMTLGFNRANLQLWESVPSYPPPPAGSTYRRTGTLGRSLGSGAGGGRSGRPAIYEVRSRGGFVSSEFGTNLGYAVHVIGDRDTQQAGHMRHWWTLAQDVWQRAEPKVTRTFETIVEILANFLEGKGEPPNE